MSALVEHENAALTLPGKVSPTALILPPGLSFSEIEDCWRRTEGAGDSLNWWRGDVLEYAEQNTGELYAQLVDPENSKSSSYRVYKHVAAKFPPDTRYARNILSWASHRALCKIDTALERHKVTAVCAANNQKALDEQRPQDRWSSREIAERLKAWEGGAMDAFNQDWTPPAIKKPGKLIDVPDDAETPDDDRPVFDQGAAGEAMAAERHDRERPAFEALPAAETVSKAIDLIERLTVQDEYALRGATINPDRMRAAANRLTQIADDIAKHKSPSRVEPSPPAAAPREAPANTPPVGCPPSDPVGGGTHSASAPLASRTEAPPEARSPVPGSQLAEPEIPACLDRRSKEAV